MRDRGMGESADERLCPGRWNWPGLGGAGRARIPPLGGRRLPRRGHRRGWHQKAGTPHAEIHALAQAGSRALGAALYVTLEPCCHDNKRTPPCVDAVLSSGVSRVVVSAVDPNPRVRGKGSRASGARASKS